MPRRKKGWRPVKEAVEGVELEHIRLTQALEALSESDQKAIFDWLEEQMRIARKVGNSGEPRVYPPAAGRPALEVLAPRYQ